MVQERLEVIKYENKPEWNRLEIKGKWTEWTISSYSDGDVEIEATGDDTTKYLILNQDELKQVIEFLQSKVIK